MDKINPVELVKKTAKRIKKKYPYIKVAEVQSDLANYLGFKKWSEMLKAAPQELQKRIKEKPLRGL